MEMQFSEYPRASTSPVDDMDNVLQLSADRLETFRQKINKYAHEDLIEGPLDGDMALGLVDVYARSSRMSSEHIGRQVAGLVARLEGDSWRQIAHETGVGDGALRSMHESAAKIIARQMKLVLALPAASNRFSPKASEELREKVNHHAGEELLKAPLDEDELLGLVDLYARAYRYPDVVGGQVDKLLLLLEGKKQSEVALEMGTTVTALTKMKINVFHILARELDTLFNTVQPVGAFSPERVEAFRQQINLSAEKELLHYSLDEDELYGLMTLYALADSSDMRPPVDEVLGLLRTEDKAENGDAFNVTPVAEIVARELDTIMPLGEFSPQRAEAFRQKINEKAGNELLEPISSRDEVVGLLELYGRRYGERNYVEVASQVDKLIALLESASTHRTAEELGVNRSGLIAIQAKAVEVLAFELKALFGPEEIGRFSPYRVEDFRRKINEVAEEDILSGPLEEDEVHGLLELYGRTNRQQVNVGKQILRLTAFLEGENWAEIAKKADVAIATLSGGLYPKAVEIIARHLLELPEEPTYNQISTNVDAMASRNMLPQAYAALFKRHIGIVRGPLNNGEIRQNNDICEKINESIMHAIVRDRKRRDRRIDNVPDGQQLRIVLKLLGNRKDAIDPLSRAELLRQYAAQLRRQLIDESEIQRKVDQYDRMVDDALLKTFQWVLTPEYLDTNGSESS